MTKMHRFTVPFLSAVLLLAGTATALANDPVTPTTADCDAKGDVKGDVDCEQTGEQGTDEQATGEKGEKAETGQTGDQGQQGDDK